MPRHEKLVAEIISISVADVWDAAREEWLCIDIKYQEEPDTCICGKHPIKETYFLRNTQNGNQATTGNDCILEFTNDSYRTIFDAVHRVRSGESDKLNEDTIVYAHQKNWINDWEKSFYINTWRKRYLSDKQERKSSRITNKIMRRIVRRSRAGMS